MSSEEKKQTKQAKKVLSTLTRSANRQAKSAIETIVNRFTQVPTEAKKSNKSSTRPYDSLSSAQKSALHGKVRESMKKSSLTASGDREKAGQTDKVAQSPKSATQALKESYQFMQKMAEARIPLSPEILLELHRLALPHLSEQDSGIRQGALGLPPGAYFIDHQEINPLLSNLIDFINNPPADMDWAKVEAIAQGVFLSIHPFRDGNGRVSNLLAAYMSILHGQIPPIFPDNAQQHAVLAEIGPDGMKHAESIIGFQEMFTSGVVPSSLSLACMRQFQEAGEFIPGRWQLLDDGKPVSHNFNELHRSRAKHLLTNIITGREKALKTIQKTQPSKVLVEKPENKPETQLIEYFINTSSVWNHDAGQKQKTKIIADLVADGIRSQPGVVSSAIINHSNHLMSQVLWEFIRDPNNTAKEAKLTESVNHLNFLQTCILNNPSLLTLNDRKNLSDFHQALQSHLPKLSELAKVPTTLNTWIAFQNLAAMGTKLGFDKPPSSTSLPKETEMDSEYDLCYPNTLIGMQTKKTDQCTDSDTEVKSIPRFIDTSIQPDPIEKSQTNGASRLTPFSFWRPAEFKGRSSDYPTPFAQLDGSFMLITVFAHNLYQWAKNLSNAIDRAALQFYASDTETEEEEETITRRTGNFL